MNKTRGGSVLNVGAEGIQYTVDTAAFLSYILFVVIYQNFKTIFYHAILLITYYLAFYYLYFPNTEPAAAWTLLALHLVFLFIVLVIQIKAPILKGSFVNNILNVQQTFVEYSIYIISVGWLFLLAALSMMVHVYMKLMPAYTEMGMPISFGGMETMKWRFYRVLMFAIIFMWIFYLAEYVKAYNIIFFTKNQVLNGVVFMFGVLFVILSVLCYVFASQISVNTGSIMVPRSTHLLPDPLIPSNTEGMAVQETTTDDGTSNNSVHILHVPPPIDDGQAPCGPSSSIVYCIGSYYLMLKNTTDVSMTDTQYDTYYKDPNHVLNPIYIFTSINGNRVYNSEVNYDPAALYSISHHTGGIADTVNIHAYYKRIQSGCLSANDFKMKYNPPSLNNGKNFTDYKPTNQTANFHYPFSNTNTHETTVFSMFDTNRSLNYETAKKLRPYLSIKNIKYYLDSGYPLAWTIYTNKDFYDMKNLPSGHFANYPNDINPKAIWHGNTDSGSSGSNNNFCFTPLEPQLYALEKDYFPYTHGHVVTIIGYIDNVPSAYQLDGSPGVFVFQNSWGKNWGHNGLGYVTYRFLINANINIISSNGVDLSFMTSPTIEIVQIPPNINTQLEDITLPVVNESFVGSSTFQPNSLWDYFFGSANSVKEPLGMTDAQLWEQIYQIERTINKEVHYNALPNIQKMASNEYKPKTYTSKIMAEYDFIHHPESIVYDAQGNLVSAK